MRICEIFKSIEGEGLYAGTPTAFVRTVGCNLQCAWCDTKYTERDSKEMSLREIVNAIWALDCTRVSITGGEPLIQEQLPHLVSRLRGKNHMVHIETNCVLIPPKMNLCGVYFTVSPKLPSSRMHYTREAMRWFANFPRAHFKFVIADGDDYRLARLLMMGPLGNQRVVYFQPCFNPDLKSVPNNLALQSYANTFRALIEKVLEDPVIRDRVRVMPQLHKIAWSGIERGV